MSKSIGIFNPFHIFFLLAKNSNTLLICELLTVLNWSIIRLDFSGGTGNFSLLLPATKLRVHLNILKILTYWDHFLLPFPDSALILDNFLNFAFCQCVYIYTGPWRDALSLAPICSCPPHSSKRSKCWARFWVNLNVQDLFCFSWMCHLGCHLLKQLVFIWFDKVDKARISSSTISIFSCGKESLYPFFTCPAATLQSHVTQELGCYFAGS